MSTALRQLVLKIHSRCDLACDHCYIYEHGDSTWASLPKVMSEETAARVARRFSQYAVDQGLEEVLVILHGGEPLLVGPRRMRAICERLIEELSPVTSLDLRIHTNGVTLNRTFLRLFDELGVKVGISLDGDRAANDRHRRDRRGRSSYDRVLRAVELLSEPEFRHLYQGLLCTVDVANDPVAVHDALVALDPPRIDYLLPHATWDHPPGRPVTVSGREETPYADWLLAVFDRWDEQGQATPVRLFDSVLSTLRGGPSLTEALGLEPSDLAVVETDGSFEQADSLKTAFDGAAATGYDVHRHGFETLAAHPGVLARQTGIDGLAAECRSCPVVDSCGGGLYAHRYRSGHGFRNPSVYCADLKSLIEGVAERVTSWDTSPVVRSDDELAYEQSVLNRTVLAGLEPEGPVWEAFTALDASPAGAAGLDDVLRYPYVRGALLAAAAGRGAGAARLGATAVAAAVRSRTEVRVSWRGQGPRLHLPSLGTLTLGGMRGSRGGGAAVEGRIEVVVHGDGRTLDVRDEDAGVKKTVVLRQGEDAWRPLEVLHDGVLLDDADPHRDCFGVPDAGRLSEAEREAFSGLWKEARRLLESRVSGQARRVVAVTPLRPGTGVHLCLHGEGALGVGIDTSPEELALEVFRATRQGWLRALRECTDLTLVGSPAGQLLDEADRSAAEAVFAWSPGDRDHARDNAGRALDAIESGHLTGSGREVAARLRAELAAGRCG